MFKKFKTTALENIWLSLFRRKKLTRLISGNPTQNLSLVSAMSQVYLSVPATSTPSERGFSGGRLICHHTRGSLSAEKLSALMCLNSWIKNGFEKKNKLPFKTKDSFDARIDFF